MTTDVKTSRQSEGETTSRRSRNRKPAGEPKSPLFELRKSLGLTQVTVAETLGLAQTRVSAIERVDISTLQIASLADYLAAIGATLTLTASFPDRDVVLN